VKSKNDYQKEINEAKRKLENKITEFKDQSEKAQIELLQKLQDVSAEEVKELYEIMVNALQDADASLSDIPKLVVNITSDETKTKISQEITKTFDIIRQSFDKAKRKNQELKLRNISVIDDNEIDLLINSLVNQSNILSIKRTLSDTISSINANLIKLDNIENNKKLHLGPRFGSYNVTSHPRDKNKFDVNGLIESLNAYKSDLEKIKKDTANPKVILDEDLLSPTRKVLNSVESINDGIKKIQQKVSLFNSDQRNEIDLVDYLKGLHDLVYNVKSQINHSLRNINNPQLRSNFNNTINAIDETLAYNYKNLLSYIKDYANYDQLPNVLQDQLNVFNDNASRIFELSYENIEKTVRLIDSINTNDELEQDYISNDLDLQNKQIKSKLYETLKDNNGNIISFGEQKFFDQPLVNEIPDQIKKMALLPDSTDRIVQELQNDRFSNNSIADIARQHLFGFGNRELFYQKNRNYQHMMHQAQKTLKDGLDVYHKSLNTKDDNLAEQSLNNVGNILSQVAKEQISMINSLNMSKGMFFDLSKSDVVVVEEYTKNVEQLVENYNILIDALEKIDPESSILKKFKNERKELYNSREKMKNVKEISVSFSKAIKDVFNSSKNALLFFAGSTAMMFGGSTILDFLNPFKAIAKSIDKMNQQGELRASIAKTDIAHGANINLDRENDLSFYSAQDLYEKSFGMIDFPEITRTYVSLFNYVGGQYNSNPEQAAKDMQYFAKEFTQMKEIYGMSDSTLLTNIKVFYKDLGMSAEDTVKHFKSMEITAIQNNVSVESFSKIVTPLASTYRNLGFSEVRAHNIITSLLKDRNMLIEDALSLSQNVGKAVSGWNMGKQSNWSKNIFFDMFSGEGNVFSAFKDGLISTDRFGKVNDKYYDVMFDRMWAQINLYGGIDTSIGQFTFAKGLKENGFSEKDISMSLYMAQEGRLDELKDKLKGIAQNKNVTTSEVTRDYTNSIEKSANQLAETHKMESTYASHINNIAFILHNAFAGSIRSFVQWIEKEVKLFVDKFSQLFSWFGDTKIGRSMIDFAKQHPILSSIGLYTTGKLAMLGGGKLLRLLISLPSRLITSAPKASERGLIAGIVNAFEGISSTKKAAIIASILAGTITLGDAINDYSKRSDKDSVVDFLSFLASGDAKVKMVKKPKTEEDSMFVTLLTTAVLATVGLSFLKRGKIPTNMNTMSNSSLTRWQKIKSFFTNRQTHSGLPPLPQPGAKMSSAQRRLIYQNRRQYMQQLEQQRIAKEQAMQQARLGGTSWGGAAKTLGRNAIWGAGFELAESIATGEDFSMKDVAVNTAKMTVGELVGSTLLGGITSAVASRVGIRNPAAATNMARNIGGFLGIAAINIPFMNNSMFSQAEASETPQQYDLHHDQYNYLLEQQNIIAQNKSSETKNIDENEGKNFIDKYTGINNRKFEVVLAKESTFAQTKSFADAAMKLGLSNREFESIVAMSLLNHNIEWQKLNDDQKGYWFKKYQEYLKIYGDNQFAIMQASKDLSKNPTGDSNLIKKQISEQLKKEWDNDDNVKGSWFQRMSQDERYNEATRNKYEFISNYYYHSQENANDENSYWFKQANVYHAQAEEDNLNQYIKSLWNSWHGKEKKSNDLSGVTADELKAMAKYYAEQNVLLAEHEYMVVKGQERWKEEEEKLKNFNSSGNLAGLETNALSGDALEIAKNEHPEIYKLIIKYSNMYNVDPRLVAAVIKNESGFVHDRGSSAGAYGLMQLMPETAEYLGVDRMDMEQNVMGGTKYLAQNIQQYNGDILSVLAAYNWGSGNLSKTNFSSTHDMSVLPQETRNYINNILSSIGGEKQTYSLPSSQSSSVELANQVDPSGNQIRYTKLADGTLVPLYGQYWDGGTYDTLNGTGNSMGQSACGPTALAMALSNMTGRYITPRDVADWSTKQGFHEGFGMSHEAFAAAKYQYGVGFHKGTKEEALRALKNNIPVVVGASAGSYFTQNGHFITYAGLRSDGSVIVHDPNDTYTQSRVNETISDSELWRDDFDYWIPDETKKGATQFGGATPELNTQQIVSSKTAKEQIENADAIMKRMAQSKGRGVIASGALVDDMYVDPNKKVVTLDEQRKKIREKYGIYDTKDTDADKQLKKDLRAQIDMEFDKIDEIREAIKLNPELIPKKHFKEAIEIIKNIAEKYMNNVEISADCVIN